MKLSETSDRETPPQRKSFQRSMTLSEQVSFADLSKAKKYREESSICLHKKDNTFNPYPICSTPLTTLGKYSVGLELYFLLTKQLTILFLLISLISAWPMYNNFIGGGLGSLYQSQLYTYFSLANQSSLTYIKDKSEAKQMINELLQNSLNQAIADGIYCLLFLGFILQYIYASNKVTASNLTENVTAGDYAVEVKGFPLKLIKSEKIKNHFEKFGKIAEVSLARGYNGKLKEFKKRAEISYKLGLSRLIEQRQKKRRFTVSALERAQVEFDEKLNKDLVNKTHDELPVIRAFILFEKIGDRKSCLLAYKEGRKLCCRRKKQPADLMFKNKYPIIVKPATEPSDILWENLEVPHRKRVLRRLLGIIMTVPVILVSISIVYVMKSYTNSLPQTTDCNLLDIQGTLVPNEAKILYTSQNAIFCYCKQQNLYKLASERLR